MPSPVFVVLMILSAVLVEPGTALAMPGPLPPTTPAGHPGKGHPGTVIDDKVEARDPWKIRFSGLDIFTTKSIRTALIHDAELKDAFRSAATDDEFMEILKSKLLSGLRVCRHPEAVVKVERSADGRFTVIAECGREYGWSSVKIEAAPEFDVASIARYHELWADDKFRRKSLVTKWIPGESGSASDAESNSIVEFTNEIAKKDLRENFQCSVRFDYDSTAKTITPVVIVEDPGYHTLISDVAFEGHSANSESELRKLTGSLDGRRFTGDLQQSLQQTFVNSGRFLHTSIVADVPFDADHAVRLRIRIRENQGVPPLPEPLPEFDQAVVRLAQWLTNWSSGDGDLQLSSLGTKAKLDAVADTAESFVKDAADAQETFDVIKALRWDEAVSGDVKLTLSAEKGGVLGVRAFDSIGRTGSDINIMFTEDTIGLADTVMGHRWARPWDYATVTGAIGFRGLPAENENTYHFTFNGGIRSAQKSPVHTIVVAEPAALNQQIREAMGGATPSLKDGYWVVDTENFSLRFHAETGRLDYLQAKADQHTVRLACGPNLMQEEFERINAGASKNLWQPKRELTGLMQFALPYIYRGITEPDEQQFQFIARVLEANAPLDRLLNPDKIEEDKRRFVLPSITDSKNASQDSVPWYFVWIASSIEGTPAERLLALFDSNGNYNTLRDDFLAELRRREEAGPASCLLLSYCFSAVKADIARVGLDRLDFDHFATDVEPLLAEHSHINDALHETYAVVRSLSNDECELLAILTENASQELARLAKKPIPSVSIRPILAIIRTNAGDDSNTTRTLMRLAWDIFLRDLLRDKLTEMISPPPSKLVPQPASNSGGTSPLFQNADLEKSTPSSTSENAPTRISRQEQIRLDASDPTKILDSAKPFIDDDDNNSPEE